MKDIGQIESRIENVEYYTQLSLLESDTTICLFQILMKIDLKMDFL